MQCERLGAIDSLHYSEVSTTDLPLDNDFVEVEIYAAGLNYKVSVNFGDFFERPLLTHTRMLRPQSALFLEVKTISELKVLGSSDELADWQAHTELEIGYLLTAKVALPIVSNAPWRVFIFCPVLFHLR